MSYNLKFILVGIVLIIGFSIFGVIELTKKPEVKPKEEPNQSEVENPTEDNPTQTTKVMTSLYDFKIIKEVNKRYSDNYLVSPMSMAYALTILKEGSRNNTKSQLSVLLNNYKLKDSFFIKDRVSIANALFINNQYKNDISNTYLTKVENNYKSEILFDEYNGPDKINNWVKEKTFNMIPKTVDDLSKDFVLAVVNAIAIDVEWRNKFECYNTKEEEFTLSSGSKMKTPMMHSSEGASYIESEKAKGFIKDYAIYDKETGNIVYEENDNTIALEYIAIMPNGDLKEYVDSLDNTELSKLIKSKKDPNEKLTINYSIPRYTYDFDYKDFQDSLNSLGVKDMFNPSIADFKAMINDKSNLKLYVSESIHKTHIEFSESGTKAAAVTAFIMDKATAFIEDIEVINININKPFLYIIKEKNSDNIWFFGTVYNPDKWDKDSASKCKAE